MLNGIKQYFTPKNSLFLALVFFLLVGALFRFYNLGEQSYWMDEGYTVNATLALQATGEPILDSGFEYNCPMYCWPSAIIADTLGNDPFSYRLVAAIAGTIFILAIFFITRRLFITQIALLSTFFITFSTINIAWSRQARWYTLFALFFWLALYFFYQAFYSKNHTRLYYLLTVAMTLLAIFTHKLGLILPFIFLAWAGFEYLRGQTNLIRRKRLVTSLVVATAPFILIPIISGYNPLQLLYAVAHPQINYPYYLIFYLSTYWFLLPFIALSFILPSPHRKASLYLALAYIAYLLPLTFLTETIQYRYMFHLTPVLFILSAVGIYVLTTRMRQKWQKNLTLITLIFLFFILGTGTLIPRTNYYLESDPTESTILKAPYYAYVPQPDWKQAYTYIKENRQAGDIVISSQSVFNKIYLNEPGYWIKYSYEKSPRGYTAIKNDREHYVEALVIDDLTELQTLMSGNHGFIVFDYFATDGRISLEILNYIKKNYPEVHHTETNDVSKIWVYRF